MILIILILLSLISIYSFTVTYTYNKRIRLGDDDGSEGKEDKVIDLNKPGIYDLKANITQWSKIRRITLSGYKIHGVKFYFPPGCRNRVKLKLTYNGDSWIPIDNYSDPIQGDGRIIDIVTNKVIGKNDFIEVWYRNLDSSSHRVDIQFDIINESTSSMEREDPSRRRLGREASLTLAEYYYKQKNGR